MTRSHLVRASRDGDQFHYRWAARRCLQLLRPNSDLAAVAIEGASASEGGKLPSVTAGEEVIDVAEYYGSAEFSQATKVVYVQLKHSTHRVSDSWTASGLANTIEGFARRYQELQARHGVSAADSRLHFKFVTNRPIASNLIEGIEDLAAAKPPRHPEISAALLKYTGLTEQLARRFFARLELLGGERDVQDQAGLLALETRAFLATDDLDAALRLKELVTRKATSAGADEPSITPEDVLLALNVGREDLFPAPSRLDDDPHAIPRDQETEIGIAAAAATNPILIAASGGVGKSVLATRLGQHMPLGSQTVVYDCFGNGEYRQVAHARHLPRVALVQIANELASRGLCDPLIPGPGDAQSFMRAFLGRLTQAAAAVHSVSADALLLIVVDAADNAQMAADEMGTPPAFVRALVRQHLPAGVRLAMLYRPEREDYIDPPPNVTHIKLSSFSPRESAALLRRHYPNATDHEVEEFHRLSSANPRVQANALAIEPDLRSLLRSLGPNPTTVDDLIASQLRSAIARVRDEAGRGSAGIDVLCAGLATLRPLVPLRVLSAVSGISVEAVRSFVSDFARGRPLLITGDAVQFRDEPVEDWFRKAYRADRHQVQAFVGRLKGLADEDPYVAGCLPALMLDADQLQELVDMALSTARLPADSPLERRQIQVERLQFALRASLRAERWADAAKLAMKAGEEQAGAARQDELLRQNPDLIGALFEPERVQEIAARQIFDTGGWRGRRYIKEAAAMSMAPELRGDALGKLRMADDWLRAWSRLKPEDREKGHPSDEDRAELAFAQLNVHGPDLCCRELMRWRPESLWYDAAQRLADRLIDHGRFSDLDGLAQAAAKFRAPPIIAGLAVSLSAMNRAVPSKSVFAFMNARASRSKALREWGPAWIKNPGLPAVNAMVEAALRHGSKNFVDLARRLTRALPKETPRHIGERFEEGRNEFLRAQALRAALLGRDLTPEGLAPKELREGLRGSAAGDSRAVREYKVRVTYPLAWWKLRARMLVATASRHGFNLANEIELASEESSRMFRDHYHDDDGVHDEVAELWFDLLCEGGDAGALILPAFQTWLERLKTQLRLPTWRTLARRAARSAGLQSLAHDYARRAQGDAGGNTSEDADSRIELIVGAARAIFSLDRSEADAYLIRAVEVASKLGDEVLPRWAGVLALAEQAAIPGSEQHELAYRLSRSAELCDDYVYRHFNWRGTVAAITGLAPSSAIAIVSRWRDREVSWFGDLLPDLLSSLRKLGILDPVLACSLIGYRTDTLELDFLEDALSKVSEPERRRRLVELVARYASLDQQNSKYWERLIPLAAREGVPTGKLSRYLQEARHEERERPPTSPPWKPEGRLPNYGTLLQRWPADAAGILQAERALRGQGRRFEPNAFWAAAFPRVGLGDAASFVGEILAAPDFDLYQVRQFLRQLPSSWRQRLAVQNALKSGVLHLAHSHCWSVGVSPWRSTFPLDEAVKLSGLPPDEIVRAALAGVANDTELAEATDLFGLVPLIALLLGSEAAQSALDFSMSLIEASIEPSAFDGPWRPDLSGSGDVSGEIAGLIWGTLGSVNEPMRWQAAHVVRILASLGHDSALNQIVACDTNGAGPSVSPTLPFYDLAARQWLMLALARSARETPQTIAGFADYLGRYANRDQKHVLIRKYAADALIALAGAGEISVSAEERERLETINAPRLTPVIRRRGEGPGFDRYVGRSRERRFYFDYEYARSDMESVCRAFGITMEALEELGEEIIFQDWGLEADGRWKTEPRRWQTSMQSRDRANVAGETYDKYLSYHATMTAAGKLLDSHQVVHHPDDRLNEFSTWLGYETLTRPDGLWLADRRDPTPTLAPPLSDIPEDDWPWSITASDFDRVMGRGGSMLTIWADWTHPLRDRRETVSIRSALVSPGTAPALLSALQTAADAWEFGLPREGEHGDVEHEIYVLRSWVSDVNYDRQLDRRDPWAAGLHYSPPLPATWFRTRLSLESRDDERRWFERNAMTPLFLSEAWSREDYEGSGEYPVAKGDRLSIRRRSLSRGLRRLDLNLVIEVTLTREGPKRRHSKKEYEYIEYPRPYFRFYLVGHDGSVTTLS